MVRKKKPSLITSAILKDGQKIYR